MRKLLPICLVVLMTLGAGGCAPESSGEPEPPEATVSTGDREPPGRRDAYNERFPHFEPFEVAGTGHDVVHLPPGAWAGLVTLRYAEPSRLGLWESDAASVPASTLVNVDGPYEGTTAFGLDGWEETASLTVQAEGPWALRIESVRDAPALPASGSGDGVFWNVAYDDSVEWTFAADAIFKLTAYPDYAWPELLQYFIPVLDLPEATPGGVVSRTIDLASHHSLVVVRAAGAWSIS